MVVATSDPTSTCAVRPNSTPLGLVRKTLPVLVSLPKISDGAVPVTRLSATPPVGCWKCTLAALPMLKLSQLATMRCGCWVTVMALPAVAMLPAVAPPTIWPPVGSVLAAGSAVADAGESERHTARASALRLNAGIPMQSRGAT